MAERDDCLAPVPVSGKTREQRVMIQPGNRLTKFKKSLGLAFGPVRHIVAYDPRPIAKPRVDEAIGDLGFLHRSVEAIRYNFAWLEYRLSAGGHLREYAWLTLRLFLLFLIPAAACLAALAVMTLILGHLEVILDSVERGMRSLMMAVVYAVVTLALIVIAGRFIAASQRRL